MPNLQHLKLGLNCYGSAFGEVLNYAPGDMEHLDFVDLGDEE
jgi:hypothetical protein